MSTPDIPKHFISFSRKLFLSVISLFIALALCFIFYQYHREKVYKRELLHGQLQKYNAILETTLHADFNNEEIDKPTQRTTFLKSISPFIKKTILSGR